MREELLFSCDALTPEELQQAVFALIRHLGLELYRVPVEKSTNGQTKIELRDAP